MDEQARKRAADCLFDPENAGILAGLEQGPRDVEELAAESGVPADQILARLGCLVDAGVLSREEDGGRTVIGADHEKLSELAESSANFDAAIDGLTKMDGYLN